jgi:hypothetical protein
MLIDEVPWVDLRTLKELNDSFHHQSVSTDVSLRGNAFIQSSLVCEIPKTTLIERMHTVLQ